MFITNKHMSRRTVLKGMGVTMALPLLEAMVPAADGARAGRGRATGSCASSRSRWCTAPPAARRSARRRTCGRRRRPARDFDLSPERAEPARAVPRLPDDRQQHRRAQRRGVHGAGNRRRSLPLERGVPDAVASASRRRARTCTPASRSIRSTRSKYGQDTPIPSMQLCIENVDQAGGCSYGYSCAYTDSISWASPTQPLPMIRDPRVGVRSAVRRRRDAGRARGAPRRGPQHPRLARHRRSAA